MYDLNDAPPVVDYIVPSEGYASSNVAAMLLNNDLDVNVLRPYKLTPDGRGPSFISRVAGLAPARDRNGKLVINKNGVIKMQPQYKRQMIRNDATLSLFDWIQFDNAVIRAAKPRLRAARDLEAAGLVYNLPNGIAKTVMQYQTQTDITGATVSMDGLRRAESDRPLFNLLNFPLPLIHKDFQYPLRQLLASRTGTNPLDTTTASLAARRVAEQIEQLVLGESASSVMLGVNQYSYGGGTIYGYKNFPNRITYSITQPTAPGWVPATTVDDVLVMKTLSQQHFHFGPWRLYCGLGWDRYMDDDYKPTYNDTTLRQRISLIEGIQGVTSVDYISDMSLLLVEQNEDVTRLVKGMDITTVQWSSDGGWQENFKVIALVVPQLRADHEGDSGIVHGS